MLERGFLCDMALQWSLSTSSSSRRRSSVAITPLCCFVSSQIAGHGWNGCRNDSGLKVALIKCTGHSLTVATQPRPGPQTSRFTPPLRVLSDVGPQPPPPLSYCDTLKKETADCGAFYTCVQLEAHSFSRRWLTTEGHVTAWWVLNVGFWRGGSSCVSQESTPVFYISGRLCVCARVLACGTQ